MTRAKAALEKGLSLNQIIQGKPTGRGPTNHSYFYARPHFSVSAVNIPNLTASYRFDWK
jgi:hypothetical protein